MPVNSGEFARRISVMSRVLSPNPLWTIRCPLLILGLFFLAAPIGAAKEADKETEDLHKAAKDLKKLVKGMIDYQDTMGFLPPIGYGTGFGKDDPKEQAFAL